MIDNLLYISANNNDNIFALWVLADRQYN